MATMPMRGITDAMLNAMMSRRSVVPNAARG